MSRKQKEGCKSIKAYNPTWIDFHLPVIIVKDNESFVSSAKSYLVAAIIPPVWERLTIDYISEGNHVPKSTVSCEMLVPVNFNNFKQKLSHFLIRQGLWGKFPPYLTPSMFTDPVIATSCVWINGHFFRYSVFIRWSDPVIHILNYWKNRVIWKLVTAQFFPLVQTSYASSLHCLILI